MDKLLGLIKLREIEDELFAIIEDEGIRFVWVEDAKFRARMGVSRNGEGTIEVNALYRNNGYLFMRVIMISHELGHWCSYTDIFEGNHRKWVISGRANPLDEERRAWIGAYNILEGLGFDRWDIFSKASKRALSTYYNMRGGEVHECADKFINDLLDHNLYEEVDAI